MSVTRGRHNADVHTAHGIIRFWTKNSVYEVDPTRSLMRRLAGTRTPTRHQRADGHWREFTAISPIEVGSRVLVTWDVSRRECVARRTFTSTIVGVADGEAAKPPAWVSDVIASTYRTRY
jgi:hypothetical protein